MDGLGGILDVACLAVNAILCMNPESHLFLLTLLILIHTSRTESTLYTSIDTGMQHGLMWRCQLQMTWLILFMIRVCAIHARHEIKCQLAIMCWILNEFSIISMVQTV